MLAHINFGTKCQHITNPALTPNAYIFSYARNDYRLMCLASTDYVQGGEAM
jgi:hypothetical protein